MSTVTIELSERAQEGACQIVGDQGMAALPKMINDWLELAAEQHCNEELEQLLQAGLDSGEPVEMTDQAWDDMWAETDRKIAERRSK